jgi:multiple sugar transport system substrate-binding protein
VSVRKLAAATALIGITAGLAACTTDDTAGDPSPSPTPSASSSSPAPTTLRLAVYGDRTRLQAYRRIADAFTRQNPGVTVQITSSPDAARAGVAAVQGLQDGSGADVFLADQYALPALVDTGRLQPVDTLLENRGLQFGDDYQRTALSSFSANSRLQCMPAEMSPLVVYVNKKLVPRHQLVADEVSFPTVQQPSWGWTDFLAIAQLAANSDLLGPVKGASVPVDLETLTAFVRSSGGEVVDDVLAPTSLNLASDDALNALTQLMALERDSTLSPTPEELRREDVVTRFTAGQLGMFLGTRDDLPRLRAATGLRFDVWPLPSMGRARTVARVNAYCIDAGSDAVGTASDFIAFAVGPHGSDIAARSGVIVPARVATVHDPAFLDPGLPPRSAELYATSLRRAEPMPYSAQWPQVDTVADRTLARLLEDPETDITTGLEAAMTRLDRRSTRIFGTGASPEGG